jgi:hypothetical protein
MFWGGGNILFFFSFLMLRAELSREDDQDAEDAQDAPCFWSYPRGGIFGGRRWLGAGVAVCGLGPVGRLQG